MNERKPSDHSSTFLSVVPAPPAAKRCALAIVIASFGAFCLLIPFARVPFPRIETFIPVFDSIVALSNLVTAGLLVVGFGRSRLRTVLLLAAGYLFTALMAVAHMLTSRSLLSTSDLVGASTQSGPWLDMLRNAGFPLFVICYALLKRYDNTGGRSRADPRICIPSITASAVAGVCLLFLLTTAGYSLLPRMVNDGYTSAAVVVNIPGLVFSIIALISLGSGFRIPYLICGCSLSSAPGYPMWY